MDISLLCCLWRHIHMKSSIGVIISSILVAFSSMQDHIKKTKQNKTNKATIKKSTKNKITSPSPNKKQNKWKKVTFIFYISFLKYVDRRFLILPPSSTHEAHVSAQRKIINLWQLQVNICWSADLLLFCFKPFIQDNLYQQFRNKLGSPLLLGLLQSRTGVFLSVHICHFLNHFLQQFPFFFKGIPMFFSSLLTLGSIKTALWRSSPNTEF